MEDGATDEKSLTGSVYFEGLKCNNTIASTDSSSGGRPTTAGISETSMLETSYVISGTRVGTTGSATPVVNYQIPFARIVDTCLGMDRDQYYGGETLYLRIVWAPSTQAVYHTPSLTDTNTGAAVFAGDIVISNLVIYSAIEQNQEIANSLMAKASSGSLSYLIPYVYGNKQSLASTSQNISLKYNRAHGQKIRRLLWSPFHAIESANTTYDNNNKGDEKVSDFYTMLNNVRTTQFNYDTSRGEDWMDKKHLIKGSSILSSDEYYYNFTHVEDLVNGSFDPNIDDGLELTEAELKYDIIATTANANHMHYIYAVTQKTLSISSSGISLL
jgi:hypothetical protein